MPPIMGAGAFVMASYTQIPYTTIIAVAALPAILYFATVAFFVITEAGKNKVKKVEIENSKSVGQIIRQGGLPLFIPISILIGSLIYGFTPSYAAGISIIAVIVASWLTPNKMGIRAICEALALGARNMVMTGILLCSVGLVVNIIATTGIGNTFSLMINDWAGNSLLIALVLIALASLILGMGLPVTASYIVLGTLSAPALYNLIVDAQLAQAIADGAITDTAKALFMMVDPAAMEYLGSPIPLAKAQSLLAAMPLSLVDPIREAILPPDSLTFALLSGHMIIFWLSQDSNVTPPVCLAGFTAAAIAKTPPMATGLESWKIAKGIYIIPLLFAYTPLISEHWIDVVEIFAFALVGLFAVVSSMQGYMMGRLSLFMRLAVGACGVALLWPATLFFHLAGTAAFAVVFMMNRTMMRKQEPVPA